MSYRLIKIAAATALIAATPVLAQAQTVAYGSSSPVEIVAFDVAGQSIARRTAGIYPALAGTFAATFDPGSITLRFVNRSAVPVTSVTFDLNDGGNSRSIVDKGDFDPGVLIEHTFNGYAGTSDLSTPTFTVAEVHFADGTAWHAAHTNFAEDIGSHAADHD